MFYLIRKGAILMIFFFGRSIVRVDWRGSYCGILGFFASLEYDEFIIKIFRGNKDIKIWVLIYGIFIGLGSFIFWIWDWEFEYYNF